jgi:hypothetical protein
MVSRAIGAKGNFMAIHEKQYYRDLSADQIYLKLTCEGHTPRRVVEAPNAIYDSHRNPFDLVLAFLAGSAQITIGDRVYFCTPGDRLNIPGSTPHSGVVGAEGVIYLMTQMVNCAD